MTVTTPAYRSSSLMPVRMRPLAWRSSSSRRRTSISTAARTCPPRAVVTSSWASALFSSSAGSRSAGGTPRKRRRSRSATNPSRLSGSSLHRAASQTAAPTGFPRGAQTSDHHRPSDTRPIGTFRARKRAARRSTGLVAQPACRWRMSGWLPHGTQRPSRRHGISDAATAAEERPSASPPSNSPSDCSRGSSKTSSTADSSDSARNAKFGRMVTPCSATTSVSVTGRSASSTSASPQPRASHNTSRDISRRLAPLSARSSLIAARSDTRT